jgi:pyruvate kinase
MRSQELQPAYRATKIIATLGPASSERAQILALAQAGVNVFRLNFSHGTHAEHQIRHAMIRSVEEELGKPLAVLQDLQGPKIRIGKLAHGPRQLRVGDRLWFSADEESSLQADEVAFPHADIASELNLGHVLLVDDGRIKLRVTAKRELSFEVEVLVGGMLSDRKGINLPDTPLSLSPLTRKDRQDLAFGLALGVDWVALSFVQRAEDVQELRGLVGARAAIMAKIEKPQALQDLERITQACDALMVARGDLGVELSAEEVPTWQRRILEVGQHHGKPVVVATQMLESMVSAPVPTRAEASDVAHAVYAGADAVMLSAESASGAYPLEAVQAMTRIIARAELESTLPAMSANIKSVRPTDRAALIAAALRASSALMTLSCAVTYTTSGVSAMRVAQERVRLPHIGLTPQIETARRLCLAWGVQPCLSHNAASVEGMVDFAVQAAKQMGFYDERQPIAVVAGLPFATAGTTNLLRFVWPQALPLATDFSTIQPIVMKSLYFDYASVE